jgi:hypothetical protein
VNAHPRTDPEAILAEPVFAGGRTKPFAELTTAEVRARAEELRAATGWGPTAKVGSVARAWSELARLMDETAAATVADLNPAAISERAQQLWVIPPGGSLL